MVRKLVNLGVLPAVFDLPLGPSVRPAKGVKKIPRGRNFVNSRLIGFQTGQFPLYILRIGEIVQFSMLSGVEAKMPRWAS